VGAREITKALPTTNKTYAVPMALEYAACAKRMFGDLRAAMTTPDDSEGKPQAMDFDKLRDVMRETKYRIKVGNLEAQHEDELLAERRRHSSELKETRLVVENETLKRVLASAGTSAMPTHSAAPGNPPAPPVSTLPAVSKMPHVQHRLSEVVAVWQRLKNPALSTVEIYEAAVKRFEGHFPELYAETIEKRHVREFIAWLQSENKSGKTIEKEHGAIRALLTIAEHEEWVTSNPARGILLPEIKGKKVRSYTPAECKQVFNSPVFVSGERPTGCKREAAYWIPLLMLHTGARREEISQLTTDRVRVSEGVHYLAIDPIDDAGRLKTDESKRAIPVHAQLLKMGFLDFVEDRIKAGGGQLFIELKTNARGQYGAKWGDWWRLYIREKVGIVDERISPSHSFRHLFITECRRLAFREDYERALVGHARGSRKDAHDGYGEHLVPSLAAELNRIDFRGLDLSHLWKG
jgi:integrase